MRPKFTKDQIEFLKTLGGLSRKEQRDIFDAKYGTTNNYYTFKWHMQKLGIESSGDCNFKSGHTPWNKGMSVEEYRTHFTDDEWYEMTHRVLDAPRKRVKVGDVILINDVHGYTHPWIYIRTDDKLKTYDKIKELDRFIWEKKVGPIPKGHCIFHLNHNHFDCHIENLACIPLGYICVLTRYMRSESPEVNRTTIKYLELCNAIKKKRRTKWEQY